METRETTHLEAAVLIAYHGIWPTSYEAVPNEPRRVQFGYTVTPEFRRVLDLLCDGSTPLPAFKELTEVRRALLRRANALLALQAKSGTQ